MSVPFEIRVAAESDLDQCQTISSWYVMSSQERGTGIATREPDYLKTKIINGNAVIAFIDDQLAGFCYIEVFSSGEYVSNSGLIVKKDFRGRGLAKALKAAAFQLARDKNPGAKVFGITTSDIVMKINSELGYRPVSFKQLTQDEEFWNGCASCTNFDILTRNERKLCLCTAMLAPAKLEEMKINLNHLIIDKENKQNES